MPMARLKATFHAKILPQEYSFPYKLNQQLGFKGLTGTEKVASLELGNRTRIKASHPAKRLSAGGSGCMPAGVYRISDILPSVLNKLKERQHKS